MISSQIELFTADSYTVEINKSEAFRYMGITNKISDEDFNNLYVACEKEYRAAANFRACVSPIEPKIFCDNRLTLGFCDIESRHLCKNLEGAKSGFVFCATSGIAVDRLIAKYSRLQPSKAVCIDAIASAGIEGFCDMLNEKYLDGRFLRHRFSPGYGDLPLEVSAEIIEYIDAARRLGITLSDNFFMTPTKSVTAIFGVC